MVLPALCGRNNSNGGAAADSPTAGGLALPSDNNAHALRRSSLKRTGLSRFYPYKSQSFSSFADLLAQTDDASCVVLAKHQHGARAGRLARGSSCAALASAGSTLPPLLRRSLGGGGGGWSRGGTSPSGSRSMYGSPPAELSLNVWAPFSATPGTGADWAGAGCAAAAGPTWAVKEEGMARLQQGVGPAHVACRAGERLGNLANERQEALGQWALPMPSDELCGRLRLVQLASERVGAVAAGDAA